MSRYSAVIVLMVLSAGCTHAKKPEAQPQPSPVAAKPESAKAPQTAKATPATGTAKAAPPATTPSKAAPATATPKAAAATPSKSPAKTPVKPATATNTATTVPPPATKPKPATPPKPAAAAPTLDLTALEARLKQTKGIGLMTKLSLKNQVDDLLGEFRKHYSGKPVPTISELRRSYDLLMMKVLSLLQDRDQQLASDILSSRERIWGLLADPKSFAALDA
jgi:hypothetical protein